MSNLKPSAQPQLCSKNLTILQSLTAKCLFLIFGLFKMSAIPRFWPTTLKLGCATNLDLPFLVMGFRSMVDEIEFLLISKCLVEVVDNLSKH